MIATTYSSQSVYLLDLSPDWFSAFVADVELISDQMAGLSNREARRPHSSSLRFTNTSFTITAQGADARRLAGALRNYQTQPVLLPLWPAMTKWSARGGATISGGIKLAVKSDWSQFEIYEGVEPGWATANDNFIPLIWGRLANRNVSWLNGDVCQFKVKHVETSTANRALVPAAATFSAGPSLSGYGTAPRLLPFPINFDRVETSFSVDIKREELGFVREPLETLYPQANAREQVIPRILQGADIAKLLQFFLTYGGGSSFWVSNYLNMLSMTADIAGGVTVIPVVDTAAIVDGDWVAFSNPDGVIAAAKVLSHTTNTITVDVAPGALTASQTIVSNLLLARFQDPRLSLRWDCADYAECKIPIRELPAEYAPAADETLSTTLGLLPTRCYLYDFSRNLNGTTVVDRYTSFESDLTFGGNTYTHRKIEHGEIRQGLQLDRDQVEMKCEVIAGSGLVLATMLQMETPLFLTIRSADVSAGAATNAAVIFTGEIVNVGPKGSLIHSKAVSGGTIFDRKFPRVFFQGGCNNSLFDAGCTTLKADWKFTAKVQSGAAGYPFQLVLNTFAGSGASAVAAIANVAANWLAGGWIEFGSGATWQARAILVSTAPSGAVLTITMDRDPNPFPAVNDVVALYPGCDLTAATCQGRFNNYLNFLGHPFMPLSNPSIVKRQQSGVGGKK